MTPIPKLAPTPLKGLQSNRGVNQMDHERSKLQEAAAGISRFKKERFLRSLSEDQFRDRVVRPLLLRRGLLDGRDLCGPDEEGKDAVFLSPSPLGASDLVVVQTKKGNINLASKAIDNLANVVTQMRTAAATPVVFTATKEKRFPARVVLCASGKINLAARKHIAGELQEPRLQFLDADDLIPLLDDTFPELWLNVDSEVAPYMRNLRKAIEQSSESVTITEMFPGMSSAATDAMFVDLFLWRTTFRLRKRRGQVERVPEFIEIPVTAIPGKPEQLVLILGEAGAGKSTSVRRLAYVLAGKPLSGDAEFQIPVLLRAIDLARERNQKLLDAALAETQKISNSQKPVFGSDALEDGRVAVFIDALDEVADDDDRKTVVTRIHDFNRTYPHCLVILTSRESTFLKNLSDLAVFTQYRVRKISFKQAMTLIDNLEKKGSLPIESSKELIRRLEDIHGMDLSPLLVTVFAATTEFGRKDIPANITELFKKFTEMMLGRWDATKGFPHQFHAPLKEFILTKIAFDMHFERVTEIELDDLRSRIAMELRNRGYEADTDQLMDEMLNRSGLLRINGDRVEFRHLLLQEFYAGRGIPTEELLETLIFDDWWRRAVVFYFGDRPDNSGALVKIRGVLGSRGSAERFTAAGTLGLAIQACYLIPVTDKVAGIADVVDVLADVKDDIVQNLPGVTKFPLTGFLAYYLNARDSVAVAALSDAAQSLLKTWRSSKEEGEAEVREFWLIVGLLEAGLVTAAELLIRKFRPRDARLLLAIYLGCVLIQHIRVSTDHQKKSAVRICERLTGEITGLRQQVYEEFKTYLLELRRGEITGVSEDESTRPKSDG